MSGDLTAALHELRQRRERIGIAVAAGLAACPHKPGDAGDVAGNIARAAVEVADALMAELDR